MLIDGNEIIPAQENTEHRSTGGVNEEPSPNGHAHTAPPNMVTFKAVNVLIIY